MLQSLGIAVGGLGESLFSRQAPGCGNPQDGGCSISFPEDLEMSRKSPGSPKYRLVHIVLFGGLHAILQMIRAASSQAHVLMWLCAIEESLTNRPEINCR